MPRLIQYVIYVFMLEVTLMRHFEKITKDFLNNNDYG